MSFGVRTRYRTSLATSLANKMRHDEELKASKEHWYSVKTEKINELRPDLIEKFVQLHDDEETRRFIDDSIDKSDSLFTQLWHNLAKTFLGMFYTQTDINGMLRRGSMFVLSREQIQKLIGGHHHGEIGKEERQMIDLGAGDGLVTEKFSDSFSKIYATEASTAMQKILRERDFQVLEIDMWHSADIEFDCVTCLNLLDRCDEPRTLMTDIRRALKPNGLVIVALVFPFSPYVEFANKSGDNRPSEVIDISGSNFEDQVVSAVSFFESLGFKLEKWSRVPYLCEGDLGQSVYVLDDAIYVLSANKSE